MARAGDQLQYFFEVAAPTTTLVGMEIQARVGLSIAAVNAGSLVGTDQADLQISLAYADTGPPLLIHDEFFDFSTGGVINEDQIATIQTNTVYEVFMAASAAAGQVSVDDNPDGLQDYRITEAIVPGGTATESADASIPISASRQEPRTRVSIRLFSAPASEMCSFRRSLNPRPGSSRASASLGSAPSDFGERGQE